MRKGTLSRPYFETQPTLCRQDLLHGKRNLNHHHFKNEILVPGSSRFFFYKGRIARELISMLAETVTRVDDSSRKNVCSDKTMHKCLFSSVRNTEDQLFLRSLFYYPRHPRTFRYSLLLYFILVPNLDSSISTVLPKSPSLISTFRILLEQIDLSSLSA